MGLKIKVGDDYTAFHNYTFFQNKVQTITTPSNIVHYHRPTFR
jgi:hypothetical protein